MRKIPTDVYLILIILLIVPTMNFKHYFLLSCCAMLSMCLFRLRAINTEEVGAHKYSLRDFKDDLIVSLFPIFNGLVMFFVIITLLTKRSKFVSIAKDFY